MSSECPNHSEPPANDDSQDVPQRLCVDLDKDAHLNFFINTKKNNKTMSAVIRDWVDDYNKIHK